jgi:translation initiation factor 2B subunit (eIF-2B alpha/beta/delta family)
VGDRVWDAVRGAASDRVSGAAEIALRAAEALSALPRSDLEEAVVTLVRGHPSMAPLWRLGTEALSAPDHGEAARRFAGTLARERDAVAGVAAPLLAGTVVLHSYSSTMVAAVAASGVRAVCARSEPGGEGDITTLRLAERGVQTTVVDDDEAVDQAAEAQAVLVGADAIGPAGVVNKVGTRRLAEAATNAGRLAIVLAGSSKLVAADLPAPHPFERTPLVAFTAIVTEDEALNPPEAGRRARSFHLHSILAELLSKMA